MNVMLEAMNVLHIGLCIRAIKCQECAMQHVAFLTNNVN